MNVNHEDAIRFEVNTRIDPSQLQGNFRSSSWLHLRELLSNAAAEHLYRYLSEKVEWSLVLNDGDKVREATPSMRQAFAPDRERALSGFAYERAQKGFQFLYECRTVPEDPAQRALDPNPLHRFVDFLNSGTFLEFARRLTGASDITFADAQATRYRPGHFLRVHNDGAGGMSRRVAYVFNLTPHWDADWGGQLQFIDNEGHIARAFVPRFNALNLFQVPQMHAVSIVAPFAVGARYSITGWLRAR
jgi:Rps23 Pro-64 3,4-dihydroxylase Tpa1-like proline 4-hydroxylase